MRKFLVSMTLISLVVLSTTNLSFGKEQKQEPWDVECILTYEYTEYSEFHGRNIIKTGTVDLGNVPRGGWGVGICKMKADAFLRGLEEAKKEIDLGF